MPMPLIITAATPLWMRLVAMIAIPSSLLCAQDANSIASPEKKVRVAAISFVPTKFDLQGNASRLEQAFRTARQRGAQIAVAPEGVLEGYVVNEVISGEAEVD